MTHRSRQRPTVIQAAVTALTPSVGMLAARLGVTPRTVRAYRQGTRRPPASVIRRLHHALLTQAHLLERRAAQLGRQLARRVS